MIKVLFTGVGRRVELIQAFRESALNLGKEIKIYGYDVSETAPALLYCDERVNICSMQDDKYIDELIAVCKKEEIDLVIPTIDTDLLKLSENKLKIENDGIRVLISSYSSVKICRDKFKTYEFIIDTGLNSPYTISDYTEYSSCYPAFIKPKDGSSSINTYKVFNFDELEFYAKKISNYIIQQYIEGDEFTVDVFCDFLGNPISIVPRLRLAVRSGEVLKTQITLDEKINCYINKICEGLKPCGPLTVQLIREKHTDVDYLIEINPRFGGGAPLSMKAGARSAEYILKLIEGEQIENSIQIEDGARYSRFDQSVCVKHGVKTQIKGVIFDLDDTLYSEKEYINSGYTAIAKYLGDISYVDELWEYFNLGIKEIDELLRRLNREDEIENIVTLYRTHKPSIHLYEGVQDILVSLKKKGIKVGIITDGRPEGQRNKIIALELEHYVDDIVITDEIGGAYFRKPCDIAFRIIQRKWNIPFESIVYIGDNACKDFRACSELGMKTIHYKNNDGLCNSNNNTVTLVSVDNLSDIYNIII